MGLPSIQVSFKERGIASIKSGLRGIVLLALEDASVASGQIAKETLYNIDDVPTTLSEDNQIQLKLAFKGYQTTPARVVYLAFPAGTAKAEMLKACEAVRFDYLVIPTIKKTEVEEVATWVKGMRSQKDIMIKAVLPNAKADTEGIISVTNKWFKTEKRTYTGAEYCARIAGLIAGTQPTISCTYAPLPEVIEVEPATKDELDSRIDKGEFVVFDDGEKIKVARGVNSFVTTVQGKGQAFKKIKLVDLMDRIHDDIKKTAEDNYLGKYANSYDNRCLLITAINGYLLELEEAGLLERGQNSVEIDLQATKIYLLKNGRNTKEELAKMSDDELKEQNVLDNVFLKANISMLDAIENIYLPIHI